jgi:hypothetical protein
MTFVISAKKNINFKNKALRFSFQEKSLSGNVTPQWIETARKTE